jgi:hypothetical protein
LRTFLGTFTAFICLVSAGSMLATGLHPDALGGGPPPIITAETFVNVPVVREFGPFTCAPAQKTSGAAYNGRTYLVAWSENLPRPAVFVGRLSHAHHPLDGRGVAIADSVNFQLLPVVASNGTDFLVVWVEETAELTRIIKARRVSADGVPSGPVAELSLRAARIKPDVVWTGTHYLAVWTEISVDQMQAVVARRLSSDGALLDPGTIQVSSTPTRNATEPAVASNGIDSLVVWSESDVVPPCLNQPCAFTLRNIRAARVNGGGVVLETPAIQVSDGAGAQQSKPDVDWDGLRFLVIWSRDDASDLRRGLWGRFVRPEGIPVQESDSVGLMIVRNQGAELLQGKVTSDGTGHLVVWELVDSGDRSLFGSRVTRDGIPIDQEVIAEGFPVAFDINDEIEPTLVGRPDEVIGIFYTKEIPDQCPDSSRIAARFIGDEPDDPEQPEPDRRRPARRR